MSKLPRWARAMPPIHCPACGHDITEVGLQAIEDLRVSLMSDRARLVARLDVLRREEAEASEHLAALELVLRLQQERAERAGADDDAPSERGS